MGKNEKTPINVNEKEYFYEDMTEQQQVMVNHINDLNRKVSNSQFNLEQLMFCRAKFINDLAESLESDAISDADYEEPVDDV